MPRLRPTCCRHYHNLELQVTSRTVTQPRPTRLRDQLQPVPKLKTRMNNYPQLMTVVMDNQAPNSDGSLGSVAQAYHAGMQIDSTTQPPNTSRPPSSGPLPPISTFTATPIPPPQPNQFSQQRQDITMTDAQPHPTPTPPQYSPVTPHASTPQPAQPRALSAAAQYYPARSNTSASPILPPVRQTLILPPMRQTTPILPPGVSRTATPNPVHASVNGPAERNSNPGSRAPSVMPEAVQMPIQAPPHGAPTRQYLNSKVTGALLEGMKLLAKEQYVVAFFH